MNAKENIRENTVENDREHIKEVTPTASAARPHDDVLHISYQQLTKSLLDIGFKSIFVDGVDYHQVTRDITVSMQTLRGHTMRNTLYINGRPVTIQLEDHEIAPYYSNYIECRFVMTGHFEMEVDGEIAAFDENEVCFMTSTALHREWLATSDCVLINFNISKSFFTERFLSSLTLSPLQKLLRTTLLHTGQTEKYLCLKPAEEDVETIKQNVFTILNEGIQQKVGYQDICRGYIIRLVDTLATSYRRFSKSESIHYKDTLFKAVSAYIEENLSTVTLAGLAQEFHYQPNFMNNLIKRYTGLTYSDYLISLRIEHAKILLETTDLSIEEIIWLSGYHNRGFFYRKFTEITGSSPSQYRRSGKK